MLAVSGRCESVLEGFCLMQEFSTEEILERMQNKVLAERQASNVSDVNK